MTLDDPEKCSVALTDKRCWNQIQIGQNIYENLIYESDVLQSDKQTNIWLNLIDT